MVGIIPTILEEERVILFLWCKDWCCESLFSSLKLQKNDVIVTTYHCFSTQVYSLERESKWSVSSPCPIGQNVRMSSSNKCSYCNSCRSASAWDRISVLPIFWLNIRTTVPRTKLTVNKIITYFLCSDVLVTSNTNSAKKRWYVFGTWCILFFSDLFVKNENMLENLEWNLFEYSQRR